MPDHQAPLRISVVDPLNYSGMAYYTAGLASGLVDAGASVVVMGSDRPLAAPRRDDGWRLQPTFSGTGPGRPRWRRAVAYALATMSLLRQTHRDHPDWVVWNYVELPSLDRLAVKTLKQSGIKVAFIAHETEPWESGTSRHAIYRWLIEEAADAIVVHGTTGARSLSDRWNTVDRRVILSEHGDYRAWVDPHADQEAARRRLGLPIDAPLALFFGALRMSKGLGSLLGAWPAVRSIVPEAELVVAGRPYRGTDLRLLERFGAGVTLRLGEVSPTDAADFYAASDVVALPYDRVSTSGVLRYAYSAARPVIATDIGELHEHVIEGQTGLLVPPGDMQALSGALVTLLSDRSRTRAMRMSANAYSQAHFDWTAIGAQLLENIAAVGARHDQRRG